MDYSWNPIKGICPVDCKTPDGESYCYARKIYKRFDLLDRMYAENPNRDWEITDDSIVFDEWEGNRPYGMRIFAKREIKPKKIFVCSTIELFHPKIQKEFRDVIFKTISSCPQDTFQILTKFPQNIDRPMPDNVWLGVSITNNMNLWRWPYINENIKAKIKFVSHEPILGEMLLFPKHCDWFILGRLTGHGKKYDPKPEYITEILRWGREKGIPIFMKNNLKEIWGSNLIQEWPRC